MGLSFVLPLLGAGIEEENNRTDKVKEETGIERLIESTAPLLKYSFVTKGIILKQPNHKKIIFRSLYHRCC